MTRLRRRLLPVAAGSVLGLDATAAQAASTARADLPVTAGTGTVAPPPQLSTPGSYCTIASYGWHPTRTSHGWTSTTAQTGVLTC